MTEQEYQDYDEFLSTTRFDVHEIMASKKRFQEVFDLLYGYMKAGFEEERVRKHELFYAFADTDEKIYSMEIRHFIVNMLCWYPMTRMHIADKLDESFVLDCHCLSKKQMMNYFNEKIIEPFRDEVSSEKLNQIFADTVYRLGQISLDFNEIMAISINIQTFIELEEQSPEFSELIHTKLDTTMQPSEIESVLHDRMNRLVKIMKEVPNSLQPILNCGEGIKHKQLSEMLVAGGLKPDMVGNTIPVPIDSNFLIGGLNSVKNFFIDKQAGRKAVVANKTLMGNAGHFAAKIMKVTKDTRVDFGVHDCGTLHPIEYFVSDFDHLRIINRSYYALPEAPNQLRVVNFKKDDWLIGRVILLRVPTTCGLDHNRVCLTCYGQMSKINDDPVFGHGSFGSAISANKYQQDTLSTKHLQTTNSIQVEFPEIFYDIFTIDSSIICIDPERIEDPKRWTIIINDNKLVEFDQEDFNSHTSQIILYDNYTSEEYVIEEKNGNEIFLYQDIIEKFSHKNNRIELDIGKLSEEVLLGVIIIENNELTKPLKNMQQLLDTKDHFGCANVDELVNRAADLIIEADMNVMLVHVCMTLKNLIRQTENIYEYPSFASYRNPDYTILRITDALVNNPSLTTGLSSQNLRTQFSNPATYTKHGKASTDVYFRKSLK